MPPSLSSTTYNRVRRLLKAARLEAGLTQEELAYRMKHTQSFVSKYETGEHYLDLVEFINVCKAIGVSPETVFKALLR